MKVSPKLFIQEKCRDPYHHLSGFLPITLLEQTILFWKFSYYWSTFSCFIFASTLLHLCDVCCEMKGEQTLKTRTWLSISLQLIFGLLSCIEVLFLFCSSAHFYLSFVLEHSTHLIEYSLVVLSTKRNISLVSNVWIKLTISCYSYR